MKHTSLTCKVICAAALTMVAQPVVANGPDHIFVGGARFVYDIYRGETVEESVSRLPNKMIVSKVMLPRVADMYRTCAKEAKFRGKVQARANVYSSHFSTVTLERNPRMTPAAFDQTISCVKWQVR